jgi:ABC-type glycerol-3-phosphate transport system substrate-binding protein
MQARKWSLVYLSALVVFSILLLMATAGLPHKSAAAQESVTVTYGQWDDENGTLRHIAVIEDFNAVNPDIEIEMRPNPGGNWHALVLTWIAAGELPDIFMGDSSYLPLYVESGGLENLRPFVEGENGFDPYAIMYPACMRTASTRAIPTC